MNVRLFFALSALFLFLAVFSSQHWHSLAQKEESFSFFLNSFDSKAVPSQKACFNANFSSNFPALVNFTAETSGKLLFSERLQIEGEKSKEYCFSPRELAEGENTVLLSANEMTLFFHIVKDSNAKSKETVSLLSANIEAKQGINWLHAVFGILFIAFFLSLVFSILPEKFSKPEKACFSTALLSAFLIVNFFILNLFKLVGFAGIFIMLFVELLAFSFLFFKPKKTGPKAVKPYETPNNVALVPFVLIIFTALFFHFFTSTNLTSFNSFYERSTSVVVQNSGLPLKDQLSYLGNRDFAFIPGYFMLEASFSFLTGLNSSALFAFTLAFASLLFVFAVYFFIDSLGLKKRFSLAFILIVANAFIFNFLIFTPRHLISFSLLLIAFAILAKYKHWFFSGVILGIAAFIQAPLLLVFIPLCFFASREFDFKQFLKSFIAGIVVFGVLFLPNFWSFGLPSFAMPEDWGYLLSLPFNFAFFDHALPIFIILVFAIAEFAHSLKGKHLGLSGFQKKLALGIVLCVLFEALVSYRINVLTAVLLALFIAELASLRKFWQKKEALIVAFIFIVGIIFIFAFLPKAVIPQEVISASLYLKEHSTPLDNVLADPYFGHSLEYLAERKTLADLWVEYADSGKLSDSYSFLKTGNSEILEKYNIKFVFNQKNTIFENAVGKQPTGFFEFPALNKVYDNGVIFVHQVPANANQD